MTSISTAQLFSHTNAKLTCLQDRKHSSHLLHFGDITNESFVVIELAKSLQLVKISDEFLADPLLTMDNEG